MNAVIRRILMEGFTKEQMSELIAKIRELHKEGKFCEIFLVKKSWKYIHLNFELEGKNGRFTFHFPKEFEGKYFFRIGSFLLVERTFSIQFTTIAGDISTECELVKAEKENEERRLLKEKKKEEQRKISMQRDQERRRVLRANGCNW